jgi:hypothetical protein
MGPAPAEIYLKLEALQPIGSFKIRGAYNVIRQLTPAQLKDGVWTVSAGNAAQGVAFAARKAGARCSVMVMDTAPDTKIRAIERLGASIVRATYDECWKTVETHGSDRMTGHFVHPFDDDRFIAGNATAGLEILEDLPDVAAIVAPLGGGGLLAGLAAAARELCRGTGNRGAAVGIARGGPPAVFRGLESVLRRRRRRQVGVDDDVAPARAALRLDCRVVERGRERDEAGRRAGARDRGRRRRLRHRRRAQRARRLRKNRCRRLRRQHRSRTVCLPHRRM